MDRSDGRRDALLCTCTPYIGRETWPWARSRIPGGGGRNDVADDRDINICSWSWWVWILFSLIFFDFLYFLYFLLCGIHTYLRLT